jgi:hypothetical protein
MSLAPVAQPVILATWETEIGRNSMVPGQLRKKNHETPPPSQRTAGHAGVYLYTCLPTMAGSINKEDRGLGQPEQKSRPCLQNNQS